MAEYTRGQDSRREEHSGHNKNTADNSRRRIPGVDFEEMNFEQRRAPYGNSSRGHSGGYDDTGHYSSGSRRDDV